ncbi:MAG: anti-sigma factor family protein [Planctomycetota bacterium]|jgi:hypothetical protein
MSFCKDKEKVLMRYLDHELDEASAREMEKHLESCQGCVRFVAGQRDVEALLHEPATSVREDTAIEFVRKVRSRIAADSPRLDELRAPSPAMLDGIPSRRMTRIWIGAGALAAGLLLLLGYHALQEEVDRRSAAQEQTLGPVAKVRTADEHPIEPPIGIGEAERIRAREALGGILVSLANVEDRVLVKQFEKATRSLKQDGWVVENMVQSFMRFGEGEGVRTAIRLARQDPKYNQVPGMIPSLKRLLRENIHPEEALETVAVLEGERADALLGEALLNPALRNRALELLGMRGGEDSALWITRAVLQSEAWEGEENISFAVASVRALSAMGEDGVDGVLEIWIESGSDTMPARALALNDPGFSEALMNRLPRLRGSRLQAGLRLAAVLRIEDTIPLLRGRAKETPFRHEAPFLIARVGGPLGVKTLVEMYQEPISLRDRKRISLALDELFSQHPQETGESLAAVLVPGFEEESRDVLIEMLGRSGAKASCSALAWIVEHRSDLATSASLALARTGSREALVLLMEMLLEERLAPASRLAAGAAAFHLGGRDVLNALYSEEQSAQLELQKKKMKAKPVPARPSRLTDNRFEKLKRLIASYPDS